jgi:hypothetical protein
MASFREALLEAKIRMANLGYMPESLYLTAEP